MLSLPSPAVTARKLAFLLVLVTLLVVPVFVVPRIPTSAPPVHSKELAIRVLLALVGLVTAVAWRTLDRRPLRLAEWAVAAFIAAQVLAAAASGRFFYCLFETWHLWALPALALLLPRLGLRAGNLRAAALTIVTSAGLAALYGFLTYAGFNPLRSLYPFDIGEEGRNYMHSFLGNPEYFGSYLAPVAVLCVSLSLRRGASALAAAGWAGAALVFLLSIALSGTRGAFLAFGLAAAVIAVRQGRHLSVAGRRRALLALAAATVAGSAAVAILSTPNPLNRRDLRLAQRFVELFDLNSASVRERIMFYALSGNMIARNPVFGSGPGTFKLEYYPAVERLVEADPRAGVTMLLQDLRNRIADHAHNDYLEVWAECGTLGFAALLLVLASLGGRFLAPGPSPAPPQEQPPQAAELEALRTGYFATALCLFANAAFSFPLHLPARASLAWAAVGLFLVADELREQAGRGRQP